MRSRRGFLQLVAFSTFSATLVAGIRSVRSKTLQLRGSAWLEVKQTRGKVIYQRGRIRQIAWNGLRLKRVGEALESREGSAAVLALDQDLGTVHVGENTRFSLKTLETTPEGGRITRLTVTQGQVRLKVRPMTNPASRLEIYTPAGIAGVRGTEFGVAVQPSGKTSIATAEGQVDTIAQGKTVPVNKQLQNLTMPQFPPEASVPLRDDPSLQMTAAHLIRSVSDERQVRLVGQTDAVNILRVNSQPRDTDKKGKFDFLISLNRETSVEVQVITPLGTQKRYVIPVYES